MLNALRTKLVSVLTGDATLTNLLAAADAVYHRRPPKAIALPCLTLTVEEQPDTEADGVGRSRVTVRIGIWSASGDTADGIQSALDAVLFDGHRGGALDTASFRVGSCRRTAVKDAGGAEMRTEDGHEIQCRETTWRLTLLKKES